MAFSPDSFKKAIGSPIKPAGGAPGAAPGGMDMDALMGAPGAGDGSPNEGTPGEESSETGLQEALESIGIQATPEQLNSIKSILGISGGIAPEAGSEETTPVSSPAPKFSSKLDKLMGSR